MFVGIQHWNPQFGQLQTVVLICSGVLQRCPTIWSLLCVFRIRTALLWLMLVSHIIISALLVMSQGSWERDLLCRTHLSVQLSIALPVPL